MSHRIIVLDEAEDELIAAQRWYETQRAGLGQEFRNEPNRVGKSPNTSLPLRTIRVPEPSDRLGFDLALRAIRQRIGPLPVSDFD
jgi:hypothetical protein